MDREDEVSKIFIISHCVSDGFGNDSIHEKQLQISEACRKKNESI